jgi:hypothetical protein
MKYPVIARSLFALGIVYGSVGCSSDSREWVDAIVDAHGGHQDDDGEPHHPGGTPECPNICDAICAGLPEPETPPGCPIPACGCEPPPECPDVCGAICEGLPEPETPPGCPIPACGCD